MSELARRFFAVLVLCLLCVSCAIPVSASGSSSAGLDISVSSSGITIAPGRYPDLAATSMDGVQQEITNKVIDRTKSVAQTVTSICCIVCFVFFFVSVVRISVSAGESARRRQALLGLLWSGVAIALFGGGWVVVTFFWNFLV